MHGGGLSFKRSAGISEPRISSRHFVFFFFSFELFRKAFWTHPMSRILLYTRAHSKEDHRPLWEERWIFSGDSLQTRGAFIYSALRKWCGFLGRPRRYHSTARGSSPLGVHVHVHVPEKIFLEIPCKEVLYSRRLCCTYADIAALPTGSPTMLVMFSKGEQRTGMSEEGVCIGGARRGGRG